VPIDSRSRLKRLTTSMSVQHGIERFLAHQPGIVFFEASRHERLKSAIQMKSGEDIPSHLMPALRVIYTSGYRAAKLLANRTLHTVEITNIATPSTYNPPGHVHREPTLASSTSALISIYSPNNCPHLSSIGA
jgi:hypothetical protein